MSHPSPSTLTQKDLPGTDQGELWQSQSAQPSSAADPGVGQSPLAGVPLQPQERQDQVDGVPKS